MYNSARRNSPLMTRRAPSEVAKISFLHPPYVLFPSISPLLQASFPTSRFFGRVFIFNSPNHFRRKTVAVPTPREPSPLSRSVSSPSEVPPSPQDGTFSPHRTQVRRESSTTQRTTMAAICAGPAASSDASEKRTNTKPPENKLSPHKWAQGPRNKGERFQSPNPDKESFFLIASFAGMLRQETPLSTKNTTKQGKRNITEENYCDRR